MATATTSLTKRRAASSDPIEKAGRIIANEIAAMHPGLDLTFGVQVSFELDRLRPGESAPAVTLVATRKKTKAKRANTRRVICRLRKPACGGGQ